MSESTSPTFENIIEEKKDMLTIWSDRFLTHTLDEMLLLLKLEFVNPDEALAIGYMIGVSAANATRNSADIQRKFVAGRH